MQAGATTIKLMADISDIQRRFAEVGSMAQRTADGIGRSFGGLGGKIAAAFSVGALVSFAKASIDAMDAMNDLADATGASIEEISKLDQVARRNGASLDQVGAMLVKFNAALKEADGKNGPSLALRAIGIEAEKLRQMDPAEALRKTAAALAGFADDGNKARIVQELFGKSVREAAPLLKDLADAGDIAASVTGKQAAEAEKFNKQLFAFKEAATTAARGIVSELLPALTRMLQELKDGREAYGGFGRALLDIGLNVDPFKTLNENLAGTVQEIKSYRDILDSLKNQSGPDFFGRRAAAIEDYQRRLERAIARERYLLQQMAREGGGRGGAPGGADDVKPSLPDIVAMQAGQKATDEAAKALQRQQEAYDKLTTSINERIAAGQLELQQGEALTEAQRLQARVNAEYEAGLLQISPAQKAVIDGKLQELAATEQAIKTEQEAVKAAKAAADARVAFRRAEAQAIEDFMQRERDAAAASLASVNGRIRGLEDEGRAADLSRQLNISLAQAIELVAIERLRERQTQYQEGSEPWRAVEREIEARQRLAQQIGSRDTIEANRRAADEAARDWQRVAQQIGDNFVDAMMQGGRAVANYLKQLFAQLVLRPILAPIGAAVTALFGGSPAGATGLGGGAGGGVGGTMNILTGAKSAFDAIKGGFAALGDSVAFAADSMGSWLVNNTTRILNQAGGTLMQSAGAIGSAASLVGGVAAGIGLGNMISGQYAALGNKNVSTIAGTAIGAFFGGPIGAAIGGAIGGAVNRLFGRKAPVTTGSGISGTFSTGGADVRQFADMFAKGGVFRSDKAWTQYSAVSSDLDKFLDGSLQQMTAATRMYATVLGQNADAISGITQTVKISLKDLSPEQQEKAITEALAGFGDRLASAYLQSSIFKPLQFARDGETASQALQRLATSLMTVNQVFDTLTVTLMEASLVGGDAASALLEAFGGADAFMQATSAYYQAFYSEAERTSIATRQLTETLARMGFALPATREEFRALVEAQDLYTEKGRQNYAALVNLSTIFDQITPKVAGLGDELQRMVETATTAAVAAVDEQLQASREAARAARDNATAYFGAAAALRASSGSIFQSSLSGPQSAAFLGGQFTATIARARGGDVAAMQAAGAAGTAFLDAFKSTAATRSDYLRQTAIVQSQLEQTALVADAMGAAADYQALLLDVNTATLEALRESLQTEGVSVELLRSQLDALQNLGQMIDASIAGQTSAYGDLTGEQIAELRAIAGAADESATLNSLVARATGNNALLSEAILGKLETPDAGARYLAQVVAAGNAYVAGRVDGVIAALNAQTADQQAALLLQQQQELQAAQQQASTSLTTSTGGTTSTTPVSSDPYEVGLSDRELYTLARRLDYQRNVLLLEDTAMFAGGGFHTGGLRIVGERGPELEATGPARYYSAQQTAGMLGGGSVADEIRALREEVAMLRYEARATAENTGKSQRLLQRVTRDGESLQVVDVTPA